MTPRITFILEATFEPTLGMITKDFTEFPEHRAGFYHMLREINANCFPGKIIDTRRTRIQYSLVWM